ncbi:hypothetical protein EV175_003937, partial [Coemansia sp. RSA 1933]
DGGGVGLNVGDWYDLASSVLEQARDTNRQRVSSVVEHTSSLQRGRLLSEREAAKMLSATEDVVDAAALKVAIAEVAQADALDLGSEGGAPASDQAAISVAASTSAMSQVRPKNGKDDVSESVNDDGEEEDGIGHIDDYMFRFLMETVFN